MHKPSRKDNMNDLDSCNEELEEMLEDAVKEIEQKETPENKKNTVQAKVADEIARRGGIISWGTTKKKP